jgi:hypothetical protein
MYFFTITGRHGSIEARPSNGEELHLMDTSLKIRKREESE